LRRPAASPKGLPERPGHEGIGPARLKVQGGRLVDELERRFGAGWKVRAGEVFSRDGTVLDESTVLPPGSHVYLYRDLPDEVVVPFDIPVLYRDDDIVVVDKPHFLATMPRGAHVTQTALVRLRRELDLPELAPAHRLDRLTAGVLLFTVRRELRGAYQTMFARGDVQKTYLAHAEGVPKIALPATLRTRIVKHRGRLQAFEEPGEPNAETYVEAVGDGLYRLTPRTGRTHQLRVHMASIGLPITGDPFYPTVIYVAPGDFGRPLQLLAQRLMFDDPVSGARREFVSRRTLG